MQTTDLFQSKTKPIQNQAEIPLVRHLGELPMYYRMPPEAIRKDLQDRYPQGTTTAQLMADGFRTATTRRSFGKVGDLFTVNQQTYRIVAIERVDFNSQAGRERWSAREGWSVDYVVANEKLRRT